MRIDASPYELVARVDGRRRRGSLLRVAFDDGVRGYADLHPWPELGDEPLATQLAALARDAPFPLASRSLELARDDAEGRAEGRSLFDGLTIPPSHASLPYGLAPDALERAKAEGYTRVKLKGLDFAPESLRRFRKSGLLFRLDFNARPAFERVCDTLDAWGDLAWIDWIEDPCPYRSYHWNALRERFGVRLALDFERADEGEGYDVRVLKPARSADFSPRLDSGLQSGPIPARSLSLALTSYLDHPLGQLGAAWTAARISPRLLDVCGLVTHPVYEPNSFSEGLGINDTRLVPPGGPGLGFAKELESLPWQPLIP